MIKIQSIFIHVLLKVNVCRGEKVVMQLIKKKLINPTLPFISDGKQISLCMNT